jgi:hypothetical protein
MASDAGVEVDDKAELLLGLSRQRGHCRPCHDSDCELSSMAW